MDELNLYKVRENDSFVDFDIMKGDIKLGGLQTVEHEDHVFGRELHIYSEYRRKGYASAVMDLLLAQSGRDVIICISRHSKSASAFWDSYLKKRKNSHIRGDIFRLEYMEKGRIYGKV